MGDQRERNLKWVGKMFTNLIWIVKLGGCNTRITIDKLFKGKLFNDKLFNYKLFKVVQVQHQVHKNCEFNSKASWDQSRFTCDNKPNKNKFQEWNFMTLNKNQNKSPLEMGKVFQLRWKQGREVTHSLTLFSKIIQHIRISRNMEGLVPIQRNN